jgi:serine/threonine protein kinase
MTKAPGSLLYMPPETLTDGAGYDTSIDIFSFGVVSLFTLTQTFPCNILPYTYIDGDGQIKPRTETERRQEYITMMHRELPQDHPLPRLIEWCLDNAPHKRPATQKVLQVLNQTKSEEGDEQIDMSKLQLLQVLNEDQQNTVSMCFYQESCA